MIKKFYLMITVVAIIFGCAKEKKAVQENQLKAKRLVKTSLVQRKDVYEYVNYTGLLEAENVINVSPSISARIKKIYVTEGDFVEKGFLLAKLEDTELQQAEIQYKSIEKNYKKMSSLFQSGSIDEGTYDEVETAYKSAKKSYDFLLKNTEIIAPASGIVSDVYAKENELFSSMTIPYLIRLINLSEMKGSVYLSEMDVEKVKLGKKVIFTIDTYPEMEMKGKISYVSPEADSYSGTYLCKFATSNNKNLLRHNQYCKVKLITDTSKNTLSIPPSALLDENRVMINDEGIAKAVSVEIGLENENEIEIRSGLTGNEEIIVVGNVGLEVGNLIEISE